MASKQRGSNTAAVNALGLDATDTPKNKRQKTSDPNGAKAGKASSQPVIVFAHGAGANSKHEWMLRWKQLLCSTTDAVEVITFDYPYLEGTKKRAPPKAEKLVDAHVTQVEKAQMKHPGHPVVLVGKSLGSRVGCMVAGQKGTNVAAIVCLGYPLKGINGKLRDETLLDLRAPVLFVQGSKDPMCPLNELDQVRRKLSVLNELYVIEGGDHSFKVRGASLKKSTRTCAELEWSAAETIQIFLKKVLSSTE